MESHSEADYNAYADSQMDFGAFEVASEEHIQTGNADSEQLEFDELLTSSDAFLKAQRLQNEGKTRQKCRKTSKENREATKHRLRHAPGGCRTSSEAPGQHFHVAEPWRKKSARSANLFAPSN